MFNRLFKNVKKYSTFSISRRKSALGYLTRNPACFIFKQVLFLIIRNHLNIFNASTNWMTFGWETLISWALLPPPPPLRREVTEHGNIWSSPPQPPDLLPESGFSWIREHIPNFIASLHFQLLHSRVELFCLIYYTCALLKFVSSLREHQWCWCLILKDTQDTHKHTHTVRKG